jgi:hygromycin-B 7''-O-kinase
LRARLPQAGWQAAVELIARRHGLWPCELVPYELGETIVWRAGNHVVKLTIPQCQYQIDAEVGCLGALQGKLSVSTPRLHAHGELSGWPYVVMERIGGQPLAAVWPALDHAERKRLAAALGALCRELHAAGPGGFPTGWVEFWQSCRQQALARHMDHGGPPALLAAIEPFLRKVGELDASRLLPAHTELVGQHVYVENVAGSWQLSGLIDFADARLAPFENEVGALVEFIFRGEPGLLREF